MFVSVYWRVVKGGVYGSQTPCLTLVAGECLAYVAYGGEEVGVPWVRV